MSMKELQAPGMEYQRDISGNYLVLKGYVDDYRVHMLEHNRIPGLLRVSLNEDDGRQDIHYDVGSRENLRHVFEAQTLNGEGVGRIISDLMRTVREMGAYMLNKDDILLDPDYMYIDEDHSLLLCYVPNNAVGLGLGLSELLRSMLAAVDNNDHDSVVLTYSLYQESLRENYVIEDLMKIVRSAGGRSQERRKDKAEYQAAPVPLQSGRDEMAEAPEPVSYDKAMENSSYSQMKVAEPEDAGFLPTSRKKINKGLAKGKKLFRM